MKNLFHRKGKFPKLLGFLTASFILVLAFSMTASAAAQLEGGAVDMTGWITDAQENYTWGPNSYFANSNEAPITSIDYVQPGSSVVISKDPAFQGKISCYFWAHKFTGSEITGCEFVGTLSSANFVATGYVDDGIVSGKPAKLEFKDFSTKGMNFTLSDCIYQVSIIFEPANGAPYSYAYYFKVKADTPTQPVQPTKPDAAQPAEPDTTDTTQPAEPDTTDNTQPAEPDTTDNSQPAEPDTTDNSQPAEPDTTDNSQPAEPKNNEKPSQPSTKPNQQDNLTEEPDEETPVITAKVAPIEGKVVINGIETEFESYEINDCNYFKLRDLAMALKHTDKSFNVTWDSAKNIIRITSKTAYVPNGSEMASKTDPTIKSAPETTSKLYIDGKEVQLTAYNIKGSNYYKLRDIAKLLNIGISWDEAANTVGIYTASSYQE